MKVLFLHHSTGNCIWRGGVPEWFLARGAGGGKGITIEERAFPKKAPYGWSNYPYDYWNIWVEHAGESPAFEEPTLEILTRQYDAICFKHCFPVCNVLEDAGAPDVRSPERRVENYRLQYEALKRKLLAFPRTKFIVWTGAALVEKATTPQKAARSQAFFDWVRGEWDEPGDNIFLWDFYGLQTDGGLYFRDEYAAGPGDSHPNEAFSKKVAPFFCRRIADVVEGRGDRGRITGE